MLEELKKKLVEIAKDAEFSGLCRPGSGNFSIRDVDSGLVVVTPSQIGRKELTAEHIVVVDLEGNIVENPLNMKPTSETPMHLTILREKHNINGVVHTHSKYATAFAIVGIPIKPVVFESMVFGKEAPVASFCIPGTQELADSIVPCLENSNAVLMEKHGVICVSDTIDKAYEVAHYLEDVAEMSFIATVLNSGQLPPYISDEVFKKHQELTK